MGILVYRDWERSTGECAKIYVGRIDYEPGASALFTYDSAYLERGRAAQECGISERLPLTNSTYTIEQFGPFFRGLLPESEVYGNLAQMYQVPRSDYLSILEHLGCESIGALTFVSEKADPDDYQPYYDSLSPETIHALHDNPVRAITYATSETRLSLSGAQSKIAWFLPQGIAPEHAGPTDWLVPRGTAPSSHIIKISRQGEEDIAHNELACSLIAQACGIDTAPVAAVPFVPGTIAVTRYDRAWIAPVEKPTQPSQPSRPSQPSQPRLMRLHQEDFCQALGFAPHLKYQIEGTDCNYPLFVVDLLDAASFQPARDRLEFAKRLAFSYAIGNSDAHLKNSSLLYNRTWTHRCLAPMYDVTCIPLTGYSTKMAFNIGEHRELAAIDERDILSIALDLGVGLDDFDRALHDILAGFSSHTPASPTPEVSRMIDRILENSASRLAVLRGFLGAA